MPNARFPDDFYMSPLRNRLRPTPARIRKALAMRAAYLALKIESRTLGSEPVGFMLDELAAIAVLMERVDSQPCA